MLYEEPILNDEEEEEKEEDSIHTMKSDIMKNDDIDDNELLAAYLTKTSKTNPIVHITSINGVSIVSSPFTVDNFRDKRTGHVKATLYLDCPDMKNIENEWKNKRRLLNATTNALKSGNNIPSDQKREMTSNGSSSSRRRRRGGEGDDPEDIKFSMDDFIVPY